MECLEISTNHLLLIEERELVKLGKGRKVHAKEMILPAVFGVDSGGIAKLQSRLKEKLF